MVQHKKIPKFTFIRHIFCEFWCDVKECYDEKHCAWAVLACCGHRYCKESCTLCYRGVLVDGLWDGEQEGVDIMWAIKMQNLFFSGSLLPFNEPINWTWSKSKPLPPKHLLKSSLITKSHQQQMLKETKILWKHLGAVSWFQPSW